MEILLLLYLAHFLGDYPLQTNWIYEQKQKGWKGGLFHAGGILIALLVCLTPFLYEPNIQTAIFLTIIVHYLQDTLKVHLQKHSPHEVVGYFLDQFFHLFWATFVWWWLLSHQNFAPQFGAEIYQNTLLILFLIGLIGISYVLPMTLFVLSDQERYQRNWKQMGIFAIGYSAVWLFLLFLQ